MPAMPARTLVVVNPKSGAGATERRYRQLEPLLREALGSIETEWTRGPRDAERIAREGARAGVERILVAGGDGTTSEVASGLIQAGLGEAVQIGLLPLGTGGDLLRSLRVPDDPEAAIAAIAKGERRRIDAGRVTWRREDGGEARCGFLNIASLGISGLVTQLVNDAPKALGGRLSFLIGTVRGILGWSDVSVTLRLDGELIHEGPLSLATAANGSWFGGGMLVAPDARLDDGLLDVVVLPHFPRARLLYELRRLYDGSHLDLDRVLACRGRCLEAEAEPGSVRFEVDGEPLGALPARFEVLPGAIEVVGVVP